MRIDVQKPIYFGNLPGDLRQDSSRVEYINTVSASTSHVKESPSLGSSRNVGIIIGGREERSGDVYFSLEDALEGDAARFIANVSVSAKVETYVPFWTVFAQFIFTGILGAAHSSAMPDATAETIDFHGTIYRIKLVQQ